MRLPRRALAALLPLPAAAQDRAITLVAPFSAGGAADLAARILSQHAPRHLPGTPPIVVENRTGASGAVGTLHVARARADGSVLLLARVGSSAILPATDPRTPFTPDDFTWLGLLDENPFVVCVRADAPWRDLAALLAALRDAPGRLNFATSGPATILDLGVRQMLALAGLPLDAAQAVPFRGGGEALTALLGGSVQFVGNNLGDMMGALRDGSIRALVASAPLAELPAVPSAGQVGLPGLAALAGWNALAGPAGLPDAVVAQWVAALAALARDDGWLAANRRLGSAPRLLPPAETKAHVVSQVAMFRGMAQRLGLG